MLLASMSSPCRTLRAPSRAAALPFLLFGLGAFLLFGLGVVTSAQDLTDVPLEPKEPEVNLGGMVYASSNGAVNEVVLAADHALILPEQEVAYLTVVRAELDSAEGEGGLDMTCDSGTFELDTGDFIAEGNVRGVTGDGRRFRTESLHYSHDRALVTSTVPVVIRDDTGTYRGGGFHYYVRENRFKLLRGATVVQGG
jgi:LPS export ABC transporter protein LptC